MRTVAVLVFLASLSIDDDKAELVELAKGLKAKDAKVRLKAVEAVAAKGEAAAPIARDLCAAMLDKDARVGKAAHAAVEKVSPGIFKNLTTYWIDADATNRSIALREMGKPEYAPVVPILLYRVNLFIAMKDHASLRSHLVALKDIDINDTEFVKVLKQLGTNSDNVTTKSIAQNMLLEWCEKEDDKKKEAYPIFLAALKKGEFAATTCKNIATFGAVAKDALPFLKMLKLSNDMATREAAGEAIETIQKAIDGK